MGSPRSASFKETRHKRFLEAAEDYTELAADLIASKGEARTCEMAREMGVSHVTVLKTLRRLVRDGFFITSPHKPIELTLKGQKLAKLCKQRHQILSAFFTKIGVPLEVIAADVEGIEHHISPETLQAIQTHMETI